MILAADGGKIKPMFRTLDKKEREKLELFLISHPDVHYLEGPTDGLNVSISMEKTEERWVL